MSKPEPDYANFDGERVLIEHVYFGSPSESGFYLYSLLREFATEAKKAFMVIHMNDLKLLLFSYKSKSTSNPVARLSEFRNDEGIVIDPKNRIPGVDEERLLPLASSELRGNDIVFSFNGMDTEPLPQNRIVLEAIRDQVRGQPSAKDLT